MNAIDRQRIKPEHLCRLAVVYVRQSKPEQVRINVESTRVQLSLRERAIVLGWEHPLVIDEDLGVSAGGYTERPGFQRMLAKVVTRDVGIIFCIDASRLSRNSKDWASLFELCGHFQTLVADFDQVYDLSIPNDRLVLGIKGTVSELELSTMRARLRTGAEAKAARGALKFFVPPGYGHDREGRIIFDPDRRVQAAVRGLFEQFDRCSSVRQLGLWYRETQTLFPVRKINRDGGRCTSWQVPSGSTLRQLLKHPIYAGVYTYGRRRQRIDYVDGRLVKRSEWCLTAEQCQVCIHDNHPGYISWERYVANQSKIAQNRARRTMEDNLGARRDGLALLAGLLRCGHCGKRVHVTYKSTPRALAMYFCDGKIAAEGSKRCLSFGSHVVDRLVGEELARALSPHAILAAQLAPERHAREQGQLLEQAQLQVQAAEYEAGRAFEQYDLVDPKNRLVADTLEAKLNEKLVELETARERLEQMQLSQPIELSQEQRQLLEELSRDFPRLWNHPSATPTLKKRLLRGAISEIVVVQPDRERLELTIHWQGGVHTRLEVKKRVIRIDSKTELSLVELVRSLAALTDAEIARILNLKQQLAPRGHKWTQDGVARFRKAHDIQAPRPVDAEEYLTGKQVAERLGISRCGVEGLIRIGALHNHQVIEFAPWRIARSEVDSAEVRALVKVLKRTGRLPREGCLECQLSLTTLK